MTNSGQSVHYSEGLNDICSCNLYEQLWLNVLGEGLLSMSRTREEIHKPSCARLPRVGHVLENSRGCRSTHYIM